MKCNYYLCFDNIFNFPDYLDNSQTQVPRKIIIIFCDVYHDENKGNFR